MLLCEAVADGTIDTIGSDHSPCPPELKQLSTGDFFEAWGGISSLQLTLPAVWSVGRNLGWDLQLMAERLSERPAKLFGFARSGRIQAGCQADLVVWDPDDDFVVSGKALQHRHGVTPYEGRRLNGVVWRTYLRGSKAFDRESSIDQFDRAIGVMLKRVGGKIEANSCSVAARLNAMTEQQRRQSLETCCAAIKWISRMLDEVMFVDDEHVLQCATEYWQSMAEADYLEAFAAHPRIGDVDSLQEKYSNTKLMAGGEQAGVDSASPETIQKLAKANDDYFKKFGFIFIVFATGKSAEEMLQILETRLENDRDTEIRNAADAQLQITTLRLKKLIG